MPPILRVALIPIWPWAIWAQGGSSIITLVMPPPGAEGYQALQSGGAFAEGAGSQYYNPALLPQLERGTGSQIHFTRSGQKLLPILGIRGLRQTFFGAAAVAPDSESGFETGIGFFRNRVTFGEQPEGFFPTEEVYALGIGLRLGLPLSVGANAKFFDSHLAPVEGGRAQGWAFDLGLLLQPRLLPLKPAGVHSLEIAPALGIAQRNLGGEAFYSDPRQSDPLPATLAHSLGLQIRFADMLEFAAGRDWESENHRRARGPEAPVANSGLSMRVLAYRFSRSRLDDPVGQRDERHTAHAVELDLLGLHRFLRRVRSGDFAGPSAAEGYPFGRTAVMGLPFRANPRFTIGSRRINGRGPSLRDGQKALFFGLSI